MPGSVGHRLTRSARQSSMAAMIQRIAFILGRGAAVAALPREPVSQPLVATPTASARRSAAQPKSKRARPKP
jgi:hypothetical protein